MIKRILDYNTKEELVNPDLSLGCIIETTYAPPEAYATIDGVTKVALADDDYEDVLLYRRYTDEELESIASAKLIEINRTSIDALPDAVAELSQLVSYLVERIG